MRESLWDAKSISWELSFIKQNDGRVSIEFGDRQSVVGIVTLSKHSVRDLIRVLNRAIER